MPDPLRYTCTGEIRSEQGAELGGAAVVAINAGQLLEQHRTISGPDGRFRVALPPGNYDLFIQHVDHALTILSSVEVRNDLELPITLTLAGTRMSNVYGRVSLRSGAPVPHCRIELLHGITGLGLALGYSNENGAFELSDCQTGFHRLRIARPDGTLTDIPLPKPDKSADLRIRLSEDDSAWAVRHVNINDGVGTLDSPHASPTAFVVQQGGLGNYVLTGGTLPPGSNEIALDSAAGPTRVAIGLARFPDDDDSALVHINARLLPQRPIAAQRARGAPASFPGLFRGAPYPADYEFETAGGTRFSLSVDFPYLHTHRFVCKDPTIVRIHIRSLWCYTRGFWADAPQLVS